MQCFHHERPDPSTGPSSLAEGKAFAAGAQPGASGTPSTLAVEVAGGGGGDGDGDHVIRDVFVRCPLSDARVSLLLQAVGAGGGGGAGGVQQAPGSAAWFMAASHASTARARNLSRVALVTFGLPTVDVRGSPLGASCPLEVDFPCQPRKYRAFSGYCNNVQSPHWGAANTRYLRFLAADYGDGVSLPRGVRVTAGAAGAPALGAVVLPSAREVSLTVHRDADLPHPHLMALAAVWGEFISHDLAHSPQMTGFQGKRLKCCSVNFSDFHPECFPIRIPDRDPVYGRTGERCQEYTRSATAPRTGCTLGPREQINQVTSYLDGSVIYGSSRDEGDQLRTFHKGQLKTQISKGGKSLMPSEDRNSDCRQDSVFKCFKAGDMRANEHVGLTAMHTLWVREHNRIAGELARMNSHWGDETLFQEARRVVAAEMQHITYTEYLPVVLGENIMDKYGLRPLSSGHFTGYDINLNAGIANSVAAAALWFVASLVPKNLGVFDQTGRQIGEKPIAASFYAPFQLYEAGGLDGVLQSLLHGAAQREDQFINEVMTNHMFQDPKKGSGLDLAAQLIQHGRDHGLPGYTKWRQFCDLPPVNNFQDLTNVMSTDVVIQMSKVYKDVSDIDLFTGALGETPLEGAVVGPTFACLLGRQFHYLRRGDRYWYENDLPPSSFTKERNADPLSPVGTAFGFNRPKRQAVEIANTSLILEFASARFVNSFLQSHLQDQESGRSIVTPRDVRELMAVLPNVDLSDTLEIPRMFRCDEQTLPCDHTSKYRSTTGWCNNLQRPEIGKSLRAFNRLLPPAYHDGIGSPRAMSVTGKPLPSPRLISVNVHPDTSRPHVRYSLMFMQFGQLLDHDLTHTPVNKGFVGEAILDCQPCDAMKSVHPECFPIPVPEGDPYFPKVNISTGRPMCIPVTRSMPGQLTLGYREQLNQVTAYVDASFVYGSDVCDANTLRLLVGGKLNVTRHPTRGKPLLPQITTHPECKSRTKVCFRAGDARASEQPALTAIHTVFLREHNRMVEELASMNSHWGDETLYQTARRILSAITQHITYREFIPRLFGWEGSHKHGLMLESEGYFKGYDATCDPTIANEFAAAAFRFGHSLLKPTLLRMDTAYSEQQPGVRLRDTFFNPDVLYQAGMIDELIRGLAGTPMETLDQFITEEVTNHLFEDRRMPYSGMDLAAINIQRGRDHGIPGYNQYRKFCNLTLARDFDDLKREIPSPVVERLRRLYLHVDDIDLFPGGLAETPLMGGVVGPTFACIIGHQFRYENDDPLVRFTEAQLAEIRKITLSRLVCDNLDRVDTIQRSLLDLPDPFLNPRVPCKSIPSLDLSLWKERQSCTVGHVVIDVGSAERISPCVMCTCTTEGPICQSLKIGNCFTLAQTFTPTAVLNDHVCKVQCAFVFRALPHITDTFNNQLGFS
ncbi:Peroxidasin [Gryllus bimaculatus]|nr:Peroxidasin [Gryllus bimaculatus]